MIDIVADLHLHSKYSRAVSPQMVLPMMAQIGQQKGIDVLATGDWTHPMWLREISTYLDEAQEGLYKLKRPAVGQESMRFLLSVEIASIYSQGGKGRRIHNLVFTPSILSAQKINQELIKRGCNLSSDGRPIIGLSSRNLLELILSIDERSMIIPAHVWTPWFGIYGQMSGFDSLSEAFGDLANDVYGIETGLSSDPEMNWQIAELQTRSILSFSDAHSPAKMGREATVFRLEDLSYNNIRQAIMSKSKKGETGDNKVLYTIEFYPEEGKYHYSGHRNCQVTMTPEEQRASGGICPVCGKKVTDGVMRRVQEIATVPMKEDHKKNAQGLVWIKDLTGHQPPFVKIVPLNEIIAEAIGSPVASPKVKTIFDQLVSEVAPEFDILLKAPIEAIAKVAGARVADGVKKVREAHIVIKPGYDGVFGVVKIWDEKEEKPETLFHALPPEKQIGIDF